MEESTMSGCFMTVMKICCNTTPALRFSRGSIGIGDGEFLAYNRLLGLVREDDVSSFIGSGVANVLAADGVSCSKPIIWRAQIPL